MEPPERVTRGDAYLIAKDVAGNGLLIRRIHIA
jgi:hypothetical protein